MKNVKSVRTMNVAVILNTRFHVETLLFVCGALAQLDGVRPVAFPLLGNNRGLKDLLEKADIPYSFYSADLESFFDAAVIISAYPPQASLPELPLSDHPFVNGFKRRRILVTHRANAPADRYESDCVISLSPLSDEYQVPHVYPCENPFLDGMTDEPTQDVKLLVQGNFRNGSRDLGLVESILCHFPTGVRILLLGSGASKLGFSDNRVEVADGLCEVDFYNAASTCGYILPLVSDSTMEGTYIRERFTSSLGMSFSTAKPALVHRSLQSLYQFSLGHTYSCENELVSIIKGIIEQPQSMKHDRIRMRANREQMRKHNAKIFKNIICKASRLIA